MVKAEARAAHQGFLLVKFFHGASGSVQERYTDYQQDVQGHTATPTMELEIPDNEGTFDDRELRIIIPEDAFSSRASDGLPHSPIYVQVDEVVQGLELGDQNSQRVLFRGRVQRAKGNYQGRPGLVAFLCLPIKARLDKIALGLSCNHHCVWNLFGPGCGLSQASFQVLGEIDSADGQEITVTTLNVINKSGTYWRRGFVEKDGLRIPIRDWTITDPTHLQLARRPPDDWILAGPTSIVFVPGCDKNVSTCRSRWNNEDNFMGLGFAIPAYQPNTESPS